MVRQRIDRRNFSPVFPGAMTPPTTSSSHCSRPISTWESEYDAVLKETDTRALFKCVEVAEAAILTRRSEGRWDHNSERQALEEALANLDVIKRERLKFRQGTSD